jgi:5-methylcytosine-specific restriction endonuclease McrA
MQKAHPIQYWTDYAQIIHGSLHKVVATSGKQVTAECKRGHQWQAQKSNLKAGGLSCATCGKAHTKAKKLRRYLSYLRRNARSHRQAIERRMYQAAPVHGGCDTCDRLMARAIGHGRAKNTCSPQCHTHYNRRRRLAYRRVEKRALRKAGIQGNAIRRAKKVGAAIEHGITPETVARRDGYLCWECGDPVHRHGGGYDAKGWTIGHLTPLSKGGNHTWNNVQCECHDCNVRKSDKHDTIDAYWASQF